MKNRALVALGVMAIVVAAPSLATAVEQSYASAVILDVEKKHRDHVLYYLYNTPIMREDAYFEVSLRLGDTVVVGEYTPRYEGEPLPEAWQGNESIQVRLEDHYIYLRKPNGAEVKFQIADRYRPKTSRK